MPCPVCCPLVNCGRTVCLTVTEIGRARRLSFSPRQRHLRALKQSDAISGYHAHLDAVLGDPDYLSSGSNLAKQFGDLGHELPSFPRVVVTVCRHVPPGEELHARNYACVGILSVDRGI